MSRASSLQTRLAKSKHIVEESGDPQPAYPLCAVKCQVSQQVADVTGSRKTLFSNKRRSWLINTSSHSQASTGPQPGVADELALEAPVSGPALSMDATFSPFMFSITNHENVRQLSDIIDHANSTLSFFDKIHNTYSINGEDTSLVSNELYLSLVTLTRT